MKHKHLEKRAVLRIAVFGILTVVSISLAVFGLISNSESAKERYDRLIAVDQAGGDVEEALNELRTYIYSHMNTQIGSELGIRPPIQLKGTYDRLVAEEEARVARANEALYEEAQAFCERTQPQGFFGATRLQCIESYIDQNGVSVEPKVIDDSFYKFDFVPPRWSPDLAGFSILAACIFGFSFIISVLVYFRTKRLVQL
jgi:hypothetical protein